MPGTLTEEGKRQIMQSVDTLKDFSIDIILCSDLKRCQDTAAIINRQLHLQVIDTPLLRERDWGSATGMVVDGVTKIVIPADAETVDNMKQRARLFLDYVKSAFPKNTVLVVSHGLFCRCIQAVFRGVEITDVKPISNTETRKIEIL